MRNLRWPLMLLLVLASLAVAACGDDDDDDGGGSNDQGAGQPAAIQRDDSLSSVKLTIGSKNFTEQKVLGEIYAQALAAGGYDTSTQLNLGDEKTALAALEGGEIDAYPEYTGTALLSFFGFQADELPKDEQEAYQEAEKGFAEMNLTALPPTPFTSSNEVAVTQETADEHSLRKISDLSKVDGQLTLFGSPECRQRLDCLLGLQRVYGLEFQRFTPVDIALRHEVLTTGQADVSIVFTTDPQIERENEVLLEDDKGMFPPYNSTLVVRDEVLQEAGGKFEEVVGQVSRGLTDRVMQELNARVDLDKETPKQVASEYLQETGLIGS
jgi:osmoprotectant transport system substrate-binding protein